MTNSPGTHRSTWTTVAEIFTVSLESGKISTTSQSTSTSTRTSHSDTRNFGMILIKQTTMENEERQTEFDNLPLEIQMRILQGRKSLKMVRENIDSIMDAILRKMKIFRQLKQMTDENSCLKILFIEAEAYDSMKIAADADGFGKETAKELDFIRHQMKPPKPLARVKYAVKAVEAAISCDDEEADLNASIIECDDNPDFLSIVDFWREVGKRQRGRDF